MNEPSDTTLAATLIATAVGAIAWSSGLTRAMWPPHPQLGALVITLLVGIVITQFWPLVSGQKKN